MIDEALIYNPRHRACSAKSRMGPTFLKLCAANPWGLAGEVKRMLERLTNMEETRCVVLALPCIGLGVNVEH